MRIVFLGTPSFAVPSLRALEKEHDVVAVVCQPDKAKDRKGNPIFGAVKTAAIEDGIPVYQFHKIREEGVEILKELAPDLMVTCAYGQILSQEILDIPVFGVLNVHGSLLPKGRGSAPIQWSLIDGEEKTGITIMKTALGMDTGDILSQEEVEISDEAYVDDLFALLQEVGADLLVRTIPDYVSGKIVPVPQDESKATRCRMLTKEDAKADFSLTAVQIRNRIRGMGFGYFTYNGEQIKVFRAEIGNNQAKAGEIISCDKNGVAIGCKDGSIVFTELQAPGKKRMDAASFANGARLTGMAE